MNYKLSDILIGLLFTGLIIGTGFMQTQLKNEPQIYFIIFSGLTALLLFTKAKVIPGILYKLLIGLMFYFMFFVFCMFIFDLIAPERATGYLEDGRKVKFNDFTFLYAAVFIGLILSVFTVVIYTRFRIKLDLIACEKYFALATFILTFVGYFIHEL
jgi:uncharacterized membrane-anchored protein